MGPGKGIGCVYQGLTLRSMIKFAEVCDSMDCNGVRILLQ